MSTVEHRSLATPADEGKRSEPRLAAIVDSTPVILWRSQPNGSAEFWNKRWYDYTKRSTESSFGLVWQAAIHPEDRDGFAERWRSDLTSGQAGEIEVRLQRFDGAYRWHLLRYEPTRDAGSHVTNWNGIAIDVEERKRVEQKLRQDEQQFRTITNLIPQSITVLAPDGMVLYVNQVAHERLDIRREDDQKKGSFSVHVADDVERVREQRREGLSRELPFELETRIRLRNGQYRWHLVQYNPERDEQGRVIRWYATATDIDDRKKAEEGLRNENLVLREDLDRSRCSARNVSPSSVRTSAPLLPANRRTPRTRSTTSICFRTADAESPISFAAASISCFSATVNTATKLSSFTLGRRMFGSPQ